MRRRRSQPRTRAIPLLPSWRSSTTPRPRSSPSPTTTDDDEEEQTITWSRAGTDSGDFTIDSSTGVLSFAQRPNYEIPVDADTDNVYNVTVRARDTASNTRELAVVVTVTDVNERPDIDENFNAPQTYMEIEYDFTGNAARGPRVHRRRTTTLGTPLNGPCSARTRPTWKSTATNRRPDLHAGQRLRPGPAAQLRASSRRRHR